jgi:hypothetical protein
MDSLTAASPNLSASRIWAVSSDKCNLSPDTLYIEVANKGFTAYKDVDFTIEFADRTVTETWVGTIPVDTSIVIKLNTLFEHSEWGERSVGITLNVPSNLATDVSLSTKSAKYPPVEPPYVVTFDQTEILPWNNLVEPFNYSQTKTFEYWQFGGSGSEPYAFFENGKRNLPGLLVTGCMDLKADEPYLITYRYKAVSSLTPENLQVLHDKNDGTAPMLLFTHPPITNTNYAPDNVSFTASGNGSEKIRFNSNYNVAAQEISINYFSIVEDTANWPADAKLIEMPSPNNGILSAEEKVTIVVTNINRRPLKNVPVFYTLNGGVLQPDTIPELKPGDTITFSFKQTVDLSTSGNYEIVAFVDVNGDKDRSNDTIMKTVSSQPNSINPISNESALVIYPNPATTEVFIKSEKEISSLFIYDVRGVFLRQIRVNGTEFYLNTSDFPNGVYLFSCQIGNERISQRIIVQNNQP